MRNLYLFFLTAFCAFYSRAQIVEIPDLAFKNQLLTYPNPIDTDEDGEIQLSEALAVTELNFSFCSFNNIIGIQAFANLESLNFGSYTSVAEPIDLSGMSALKALRFTKCIFTSVDFQGLSGLENLSIGYAGNVNLLHFEETVNLKNIYFYNTNFTSIDLSHAIGLKTFSAKHTQLAEINLTGLVHLESFECEHPGNLTNLNLTDLVALKEFELEHTQITNLNFEHNLQLETIKCGENQLSSINVSGLLQLRELSCYVNQLTAIDLSNTPNLEWLSVGDNQLTELDLSQQHRLKNVDASYNLLTTLDLSPLTECHQNDSEPGYYINDNPNLTWLNIKNGKKDFAWTNASLNCPNLRYICLDEEDYEDQNQMLESSGIDSVEINTYCSFVPGGNYNTITGTFTLDLDNNGCDATDLVLVNTKLSLEHHNQSQSTTTDMQGRYSFYPKNGNYTLTPALENPYFMISPASVDFEFENNTNNTQTQHFCVVPNGIHKDLEIVMMPLKAIQPGTDTPYRLVYKNKGNQIISGNIHLNYDDAIFDFVAANPTIDSQNPNQLQWSYTDIKPFESRTIDLILHANSSLQTPAVVSGDVLRLTAFIPVENDETSTDNSFILTQTVADSDLPNDKNCLQGDSIATEFIGDYVHYLIRFQNTGETTARNVVVKDLIHLDEFDLTSLQVIASSHPFLNKISENKIEFIFQDINLSTAIENEPTSSGFIAFKIKSKSNLVNGDSISNQASVYYDFLFPVETNTATSTFSALLGHSDFSRAMVSLAPNPTRDMVHITAKTRITAVELFDMQGRMLQKILYCPETFALDLTQRSRGIYFLKIKTLEGSMVEKIIKE